MESRTEGTACVSRLGMHERWAAGAGAGRSALLRLTAVSLWELYSCNRPTRPNRPSGPLRDKYTWHHVGNFLAKTESHRPGHTQQRYPRIARSAGRHTACFAAPRTDRGAIQTWGYSTQTSL